MHKLFAQSHHTYCKEAHACENHSLNIASAGRGEILHISIWHPLCNFGPDKHAIMIWHPLCDLRAVLFTVRGRRRKWNHLRLKERSIYSKCELTAGPAAHIACTPSH